MSPATVAGTVPRHFAEALVGVNMTVGTGFGRWRNYRRNAARTGQTIRATAAASGK